MKKRYTFTLYIGGTGDSPQEAWDDAIEGLLQDDGLMYDDESYTTEDLDETDINE